MSVIVRLPTALRRLACNLEQVVVEDASTVREAVSRVVEQHPGLQARLLAADGCFFRFVGVFLNAHDIRHLQNERTAVHPGDTITIVTAIAGG